MTPKSEQLLDSLASPKAGLGEFSTICEDRGFRLNCLDDRPAGFLFSPQKSDGTEVSPSAKAKPNVAEGTIENYERCLNPFVAAYGKMPALCRAFRRIGVLCPRFMVVAPCGFS